MSHGHHHGHGYSHARDNVMNDMVMHPHAHAQRLRREYINYGYLFGVSFMFAVGEFLIAILLAHSVSAQTDAIHGLTHVALYGLAFWVSRQIYMRQMTVHNAHHYRERFIILYVPLVFMGLAWTSYTSVVKLLSSETVVSAYMLASVSVGLCGTVIALRILHTISTIHREAVHRHTAHHWISLDTWGDFAFSVIVLITSIAAIIASWLPIYIIDPVLSFVGIIWIGLLGVQILRKKTI